MGKMFCEIKEKEGAISPLSFAPWCVFLVTKILSQPSESLERAEHCVLVPENISAAYAILEFKQKRLKTVLKYNLSRKSPKFIGYSQR